MTAIKDLNEKQIQDIKNGNLKLVGGRIKRTIKNGEIIGIPCVETKYIVKGA